VAFASIFGLTLSRITFRKERRDYLRQRLLEASTEMVRLSELRYRQLVDNAPIGIFCTKPDGQVISANPALLRTLEVDSVDALNAHGLLNLYADPSARSRLWDLARQQGSVSGFETRFRLPGGRVVPVAIGATWSRRERGRCCTSRERSRTSPSAGRRRRRSSSPSRGWPISSRSCRCPPW